MPRRKSCSLPRAATPPSGLATNTSPCHFPSHGSRFLPFETAASMRLRLTATFRAPARASPPASKPSPNSSIPPLKFRARPEQPSCQSLRKRAPPAPLRFSPSHLGRLPLDTCSRDQLTILALYIRFLYVRGEPHDRNGNQTRHCGACGSKRPRTRPSPRLRNGAAHRAANQRRTALHACSLVSHALPLGAARLDSRCLGNQQQRPAAALLSHHAPRKEKAVAAPPGMVGTLPSFAAAQ